MKQAFCLFIVVVFLFGAAVANGVSPGLQSIDCSDASSISFSIYIPDIDEWEGSTDERSWSLNGVADEVCEPEFDYTNHLVKYSGINVDICHVGDPTTTPDKFEYEFVISVAAEAGSTIDPVTFAYDHEYVVTCFYNREKEDLMASFQPSHSLTDTGSGVADFLIDFTVHKADDDSEVTAIDILDLRTKVYGKIEIVGSNSFPQNLDVHLREVTADTDNVAGGDDQFSLITDGCGKPLIVTATTCDADGDDTFDFEIFRFPRQNTLDEVFLRAKVIVCLESNPTSICKTECGACPGSGARRKRRDTLEELQQTEFYVTAGPFKIRDPDHQDSDAAAGEDKGTEGTPFPAYMIAVVAVCGLLAVAIVSAVVLIVFHRRRQNVGNDELKNEDSVTA